MKKLLLVLLAVVAGAIGFSALHRAAEERHAAAIVGKREWQALTNDLIETQETVAALRAEVLDKKSRLQETSRHPNISPDLLQLLEADASKGHPAAWAELRQQLGIGWNSSPDYVLVSKRVLNHLDYHRLVSVGLTDTARELLAVSPGEQSALRSVLQRAREGEWLKIERTEPAGDIVAQYTVPAPDSAFAESVSNEFAAGFIDVLGPERANLMLPHAWREFRDGLAPPEPETLTIRRSVADGESDLVWEMKRGNRQLASSPVRYAYYPSMWFLTFFPGGWKTLAEREGFELPQRFQPSGK